MITDALFFLCLTYIFYTYVRICINFGYLWPKNGYNHEPQTHKYIIFTYLYTVSHNNLSIYSTFVILNLWCFIAYLGLENEIYCNSNFQIVVSA